MRRSTAPSRRLFGPAGRARCGATSSTTWAIVPGSFIDSGAGRHVADGSRFLRSVLGPVDGPAGVARQHDRQGTPRCLECCAQQRRRDSPMIQQRRLTLKAGRLRRRRGPYPAARTDLRQASAVTSGTPNAGRRTRPRSYVGHAMRRSRRMAAVASTSLPRSAWLIQHLGTTRSTLVAITSRAFPQS